MSQRNPNPNPDDMLPPWLRGMDEEVAPIKDVGAFSSFLSTADALPETIDTEMTYDQWMAIQKEAKREKSIEEELPEFDFNAFGADAEASVSTGRLGTGNLGTGSLGTGSLGTGPLGATGELPDWYLGLEELDESDAPEWFTASGVSPFVDTGQLSGLVPPAAPAPPQAAPQTPPPAPPAAPKPRPISASTSAPLPPAVQPPSNRPDISALPPWMQDMMADDSPETSAPAQSEPAAPNAIDSMFGEMNLSQGSFGAGFEDTFSGGTAESYAGEAESDDFYATFGSTETQDQGLDDFFSAFSSPENASPASPPTPAPPQRTGTPSLQSRLAPSPTRADDDELPDFAMLQGSGRGNAPAFEDAGFGTRPLSQDEIADATGYTDFGTRKLTPEELGYDDEIGTRQLTQEELGYGDSYNSDSGENFGTRQFSETELQNIGQPSGAAAANTGLYDQFDPFALDFDQTATADTADTSAYVAPDASVEEPDLDIFLNQRASPPASSVRAIDVPEPALPDEFDRFAPPPPANDTGELNWLSELGGIISAVTGEEESGIARPGTGSLGFDPYTDLRNTGSAAGTGSLRRTAPPAGGSSGNDDPFAGGDFDWNNVAAVDPNAGQTSSTGSARPDSGTLRNAPDWLSSLGDVSEVATPSAEENTGMGSSFTADLPATSTTSTGSAPAVPGKSMLSRRLGNATVSQEVPAAKPAAPAAQPTSPPVNMTSPFGDFFEDADAVNHAPASDSERTIAFSADLLAMDQQAGRPENRQSDQFDSLNFNLFEDENTPQDNWPGAAPSRPAAPMNTDALFSSITFDDVFAGDSAGVGSSSAMDENAENSDENLYGGLDWDDAPPVSNARRAPAENPVAVTSTDQLTDLLSSLGVAPPEEQHSSPAASVEMAHGDDLLDSAWMLEDLYNTPAAESSSSPAALSANDADAELDLYADLYGDAPAADAPPAGRASGYLVPPDDVALYGETASEENDSFALPDLPDLGAVLPDFVAEGNASNASSDVGDLGSMDWLTDNLFEDNTGAGASPAPAAYPDADITRSAASFSPDLADDTGANWDSMLNALDAGRDAAADGFTDTFSDAFSSNRSDVNDSDSDSMNVGSDFSPYALYAEDARITPSPDGDDDPYLSLYSTTQTPGSVGDITRSAEQFTGAFDLDATAYEWSALTQDDAPLGDSDPSDTSASDIRVAPASADPGLPDWMNELAAVSPARGSDIGADTIQMDTDALNTLFGADVESSNLTTSNLTRPDLTSGGNAQPDSEQDASWLAELNLDLDISANAAAYDMASTAASFNSEDSGADFDIDELIGSTAAETPDLFAPGAQPSLASRLQNTPAAPADSEYTPPEYTPPEYTPPEYTPEYTPEYALESPLYAGEGDQAVASASPVTIKQESGVSSEFNSGFDDEFDESRPKTDRLRFARSWTSFLTSLSDEEDDLVKDADE